MKKFIYILLILVSGSVTSCVIPFDPGFDKNPLIFLEAFPGTDADHIVFRILPAYSRSNNPVVSPFKPEIIFEVNGNGVPVECVDAEEGYYIAYHKPVSGDKMTVSVASEGFQSIYAETSIPAVFPERDIDYRKAYVGVDEFDCVLYLTFSGADPDYGYGLQFLNEVIYDGAVQQPREYIYSGDVYSPIDDSPEIVPVSLEAMQISLNGSSLLAWDGRLLDRESCVFAVEPRLYGYSDIQIYESFFEHRGEIKQYDEEGNVKETLAYTEHNKLLLYTMTEEFYKYKVANEFESDYSGFVSFIAPSNFCYSNIDNGYGAFAGFSVVETDWITEEFIENNR